MDPITFGIELEIGGVLIALVGAVATWMHSRNQRRLRTLREHQHRETMAMHERHHREQLAAVREAEQKVVETVS